MRRLMILLAAFILVIGGAAGAQTAETRSAASTAAWREDLQSLMALIDRQHPDPYRYTPQVEFAALADDLDAGIPQFSDAQIVVRMMEIVSLLHDGHSHLFPPIQTGMEFTLYPLVFYPFSDGVYLIDAAPEYGERIGARLVQIGGTPVEDVLAQVARLVPRDNDSGGRVLLPANLATAEVLLGLGVIDDADQPDFLLELPDRSTETLNPARIAAADFLARFPQHYRLPNDADVLSRARLNERLWWTPLDDGRALYVQYNETQRLGTTLDDLEAALGTPEMARLILDLRYNPGGDIGTARAFRTLIAEDARFQQPGSLIVLTARNTFSAAVVFALWLEHDAQPVFIGEPTGGRPLMYENNRVTTLPNSGLDVYIATRARSDVEPTDTREAIEPEILIPLSAADYFEHRDPVLEAALAYMP
ncbi:MAG: hypothetical protein JNL42_16380 [Anaerolineae bacterium]|nr:hypothetical protein [Anaerolineae bacterium]